MYVRETKRYLMDGEPSIRTYSIAVIVGNLQNGFFNSKRIGGFVQLAPQEVSFTRVFIGDLPLYNQDEEDPPG
ncbi:hypothetical protein [Methanoregula sp.]|uniref:hypothetical protein n=1 Tax=Methanoregula sp. TaxID=2052170 RepID=UPI0025CC78DB|nr:hypothetical protein [Methanoregula sp.]